MPSPSLKHHRERDLRRAINKLGQCAIEDIEWVWSTLDDRQRDRLRPLLSEANAAWNGDLQHANAETSAPGSENERRLLDGVHLAALIERLPTDLASRLLVALDAPSRKAVVDALPSHRSEAFMRLDRSSFRVSDRTASSLLAAATLVARSADHASSTTPVRRAGAVARLRQWLARR